LDRDLSQVLDVGDFLASQGGDEAIQAWQAKRAEIALTIAEIQAVTRDPSPRARIVPTTAVLLVGVALSSACTVAESAERMDVGPASISSTVPTSDIQSLDRLCGFLVDGSRSLEVEHRPRAVDLFVGRVEDLVRRLDCRTVAAGVFVDGGEWTGSLDYVAVPSLAQAIDCAKVKPSIHGFDRILARNPAYRESLERKASGDCQNRQSQADVAYAAEFQRALARIAAALRTPVADGERTDIVGAIDAVLRPGGIVFVLTDGVQTVKRTNPLVVPEDAFVVLLVVQTDADYGGAEATRRAVEAWQKVDRVLVLPYPVLGDRRFLDAIGRTPERR
jgi:hypothetical protein